MEEKTFIYHNYLDIVFRKNRSIHLHKTEAFGIAMFGGGAGCCKIEYIDLRF